jgi:thymidylate synthase (FAD)
MGSDLTVCQSARVSFDKRTTPVGHDNKDIVVDDGLQSVGIPALSERDTKLINYLASHGHWSPFAHPQICLRITAPIFVARQCQKHVVGFVWNEVSRRYVDAEPTFFVPDAWRKRADNKKQGSSDEVVEDEIIWFDHYEGGSSYRDIPVAYKEFCNDALWLYKQMIEVGVAPEQARMVLPQAAYTQWYWTGSLAAYARFYKQRTDDHAQKEIQDLAKMVGDVIQPLFPVSWAALTA